MSTESTKTTETTMADAAPRGRRPAHVGKSRRRLQGVLALLAVGLVGWGLSTLIEMRSRGDEVWLEIRDPGGRDAAVVFARTGRGAEDGAFRLLFSRLAVTFDSGRSLLTFSEDRTQLVVPRDASAVLVHSDRRVEAIVRPVGGLVRLLRSAADPAKRRVPVVDFFRSDPVARALDAVDGRLRRFWQE